MMDTRREFLKKAGLLAGATGAASVLPASIQRALAIEPHTGTTWADAEHIVILMQENRSFDHSFGSLRGVRGFNDPRAIQLPDQNPVWLQSNDSGQTYAPFRLDLKNTKATWMDSLPHSWKNQVNARNDGKYDQWLNEKRNSIAAYADMPLTLGYHTREDIPFYYALADGFTICDQHFCSALTGTNPNRLFFWTGTVRPEQLEGSKAHVWNDDMDYGTLNWTTFPERLEANGISWKIYQNELSIDVGFKEEEDPWLSNFQDNPMEFFKQYHVHLHEKHIEHLRKMPGIRSEEIASMINQWSALSPSEKALHQKAFVTNINDPHYHELDTLVYQDNGTERSVKIPKGDLLHQFRQDVKTGQLPVVSWLASPEHLSDHPSSAWYGAWYVSEVMDILTQNPDVWKKTIFILTYDENDGYFDHIPPFVAPHSQRPETGRASKAIDTRVEFITHEQEKARQNFPEPFDRESPIGLGFRVPLIIASPWSRGGLVNSEVFDHTSTLRFLENFLTKKTGKPIKETNISEWRRTVCGDLSSVFSSDAVNKMPGLDHINKEFFIEMVHKAKFKALPGYKALSKDEIDQFRKDPYASPYMPQQEQGIKSSCGLRYQLYAEGKLNKEKNAFDIRFEAGNEIFGKDSCGSPFNVYARGRSLSTRAFAVKAPDRLDASWLLEEFEHNNYHLQVYGPNGFFREFKGSADDPMIETDCEYERKSASVHSLTGNLEIVLRNLSDTPCLLAITDNAYQSKPIELLLRPGRQLLSFDLSAQFGWYDLSIKITGKDAYEKRYAGRVETGKVGFSDPFMGRTIK